MATAVMHGCGMAHEYGTPCADGLTRASAFGEAGRMVTAVWAPVPRYGDRSGNRSAAAPARRGMSEPFAIVAATDRRGGMPDDDYALDPQGMDASQCERALRFNHAGENAIIGEVLDARASGRRVMATIRLDLDTPRGLELWRHREAGGTLAASIAHEVLEVDPGWVYRATRWRLRHVSLVGAGSQPVDPDAVTPWWLL